MFANSIAPVWANYLINAMLLQVKGTTFTPPSTYSVHLFTATSAPVVRGWTISQFTEATFDGYAAVSVVPAGMHDPVNNTEETGSMMLFPALFFASTVLTPPGQTILGYWVDDGSTNGIVAELFQTPIPVARPSDFINLVACLPIVNLQAA